MKVIRNTKPKPKVDFSQIKYYVVTKPSGYKIQFPYIGDLDLAWIKKWDKIAKSMSDLGSPKETE